jgi:hypothetical protein
LVSKSKTPPIIISIGRVPKSPPRPYSGEGARRAGEGNAAKYDPTLSLRLVAFPTYKTPPFLSLKIYTPGELGSDLIFLEMYDLTIIYKRMFSRKIALYRKTRGRIYANTRNEGQGQGRFVENTNRLSKDQGTYGNCQ